MTETIFYNMVFDYVQKSHTIMCEKLFYSHLIMGTVKGVFSFHLFTATLTDFCTERKSQMVNLCVPAHVK